MDENTEAPAVSTETTDAILASRADGTPAVFAAEPGASIQIEPFPVPVPMVAQPMHYFPSDEIDGALSREAGWPLAAIVTRVWSPSLVNLCVYYFNGVPHSRTSVNVHSRDEIVPGGAMVPGAVYWI